MPYKCSVVNCQTNYDSSKEEFVSVYRLPKDSAECQKWTDAIPSFAYTKSSKEYYRVCRKHWPDNTPMVKMPGGKCRPALPPTLFNVPRSCIPTPKPPPRMAKVEFVQQSSFDKKDIIKSLDAFKPDMALKKEYSNCIINRDDNRLSCVFLNESLSNTICLIHVVKQATMCSSLTFYAYKGGFKIPIPKNLLSSNNGLLRYSQFFAAVNYSMQYQLSETTRLGEIASDLQEMVRTGSMQSRKSKKIQFLARQIELLAKKQYTMADYCFAVESFPSCR